MRQQMLLLIVLFDGRKEEWNSGFPVGIGSWSLPANESLISLGTFWGAKIDHF